MAYYHCSTWRFISIFAFLLIALGVLLSTSDVLVIFDSDSSQSRLSDQHCAQCNDELIRLKAKLYDLQEQLGSASCQQQEEAVRTENDESQKTKQAWAAKEAVFLQLLCGASRPATCAGGSGGKLRFVMCTSFGGFSAQRQCLARSFQLAWMLNLTVVVPPVHELSLHNPTFTK
jgi:hypothetical protein